MNFPITTRTECKKLEGLCKKGVIEKKGKGPAVYSMGLLTGLS